MSPTPSNSTGDDDSFARELERQHQRLLGEQPEADDQADERVESAMFVLRLLEEAKGQLDNAGKPTKPAGSLETLGGDDGHDPLLNWREWVPFQQVGRFEVVEPLGRGGFGIVFRGRDPVLNREVAIKVPRWEVTASEEAQRRFERESLAAATLKHPGIVSVYEAGESKGVGYLVSELVEGADLATCLARGESFRPQEAASLVAQLADALEHAHQRGVLHRDLKPANILIDENDRSPRVVDFGLAALAETADLTRSGGVVGTPEYMSPEQARGDRGTFGPPTDVYGMGAVLYELLAGRSPFPGLTLTETLMAIERTDPKPPHLFREGVPTDLEAVCLKCLEKCPERRYGSARELQADLQRFLNGEGVLARPLSSWRKLARWSRRNPVVSALSMLLVVGLVVAVSVVSYWWLESEQQRALANRRQQQYLEKAQQLEQAVDRLFLGLANHPEIRAASAEGLRRTLLQEVASFRKQFLAEAPEEPERKAQFARSLYSLADINRLLGDNARAVALVDEALDLIETLPTNLIDDRVRIQWMAMKARLLTHLGEFDSAAATFDEVESLIQEVDPVGPDEDVGLPLRLRFNLAVQRARSLLLQDQLEQATVQAELAAELERNLPALESLHPHERQSVRWDIASCKFIQGETERSRGAYAASINSYQQALEGLEMVAAQTTQSDGLKYETARVYHSMGLSHAEQNQSDQARECYQVGLDLLDELSAAHPQVVLYSSQAEMTRYSLAATEMVAKNYERFEQLIQTNINRKKELIKQFPDFKAKYHSQLGDSYNLYFVGLYRQPGSDQQRQEELLKLSSQAFDKALELNPKFRRAQMAGARAILNMGTLAYAKGDEQASEQYLSEALARLGKMIEAEPTWIEAVNSYVGCSYNLGGLMSKQGRHDEAVAEMERTFKRLPQHRRAYQFQCLACQYRYRAGQKTEAVEQLVELGVEQAKSLEQGMMAAQMVLSLSPGKDEESGDVADQLRQATISILQSHAPQETEAFSSFKDRLQSVPEFADLLDELTPGE